MSALEALIRDRIRRHGPMPVSDYMALALAHPDHGYYRKADPLGARGDFITAPEISQVFGELVGLWCVVTWQQAGCPAPFNLVELGPGRGTLMADALRAARMVPDFAGAATLHLVETSPALRAKQAATLGEYAPVWHDTLDTVPRGPAIVVANEFIDALPVDQYVKTPAGWRRRCVDIDTQTDALAFTTAPDRIPPDGLIPASAGAAPAGGIFEHCPAGLAIADALGSRIAADGIAALIVDYGHSRCGAGETLQAVRAHGRHDVLKEPGEADLTAHVDFEALAGAAAMAGARPWGPIPQGGFLAALGIEARTARLVENAGDIQARLLQDGCRRLIAADGMGTLFKVLALTRPSAGAPPGFEIQTSGAYCP